MKSSREIISALTNDGWEHIATKGDHYQFKHPTKQRKVTVPHPVKDIGDPLLKMIERQAGIRLR